MSSYRVCVIGIVRTVIVYRLFNDTYDVSCKVYSLDHISSVAPPPSGHTAPGLTLPSLRAATIVIIYLHSTGFCYYVWVFTVTENHVGVICAALPPLRALVARFLSKHSRSTQRSRVGGNTADNGSGYMLRKPVHGNRESPAVGRNDTYPADSGSQDGYPTDSPQIWKPLPRIPSRLSDSEEVDIDMILDVENGYWRR
jgi:hypothetical protein